MKRSWITTAGMRDNRLHLRIPCEHEAIALTEEGEVGKVRLRVTVERIEEDTSTALDTRDLSPEDDVSVEHDGTWVSFRHEGHEVLLVVMREEGVSPMATSAITRGRLKGAVAAYLRADAFFRRNGLAVL